MNILVLDFETYFDQAYSLKKLTIPEYVHDPRFCVLGLAIRKPDGHSEFRADVAEAIGELQQQFGCDLENTTVVGHHLHFDFYILNHRYGVRPRYFIDTKLLAHHVHGRRDGGEGLAADLGALARHYGLAAKGSLEFMEGVRTPSPRQRAELADYAKQDAELTAQLAELLLPQISRPEVELPILMHTVRLFTERELQVDVDAIDGLMERVRSATNDALTAAGVTADEVSKNSSFVPRLKTALAKTGREMPTKLGKKGLIPATAKADAAMQALLRDDDSAIATLTTARLEKKGEDQKLARLETLQRIAAATGGKLPPYLVYFGAHTGRFAGGGGLNIQNLGRNGLGGLIRKLLIPKPKCRFVIADLAQIEARITAWYAGEQTMLSAFAQNRDLYSEFASQVFSQTVRKPLDSDPPEVQAQLLALRHVGKLAVLGLGFGLGALTFMRRLQADATVSHLFDTGELNAMTCRQLVREFRSQYREIPRFWDEMEQLTNGAMDGAETRLGRLDAFRGDDGIQLQLPSRRTLRYPRIRRDYTPHSVKYIDEFGDEAEFIAEGPALVYGNGSTLYGGKLCENVVSATARDLLVEAVLRLEARGLPVLFHVHDEVVVEVPEQDAHEASQIVAEELNRTPDWALGLPVSCEVQVVDRYGK